MSLFRVCLLFVALKTFCCSGDWLIPCNTLYDVQFHCSVMYKLLVHLRIWVWGQILQNFHLFVFVFNSRFENSLWFPSFRIILVFCSSGSFSGFEVGFDFELDTHILGSFEKDTETNLSHSNSTLNHSNWRFTPLGLIYIVKIA